MGSLGHANRALARWIRRSVQTASNCAYGIGRIDALGTIIEWDVPTAASAPEDIVLGSDGALWFSERNTSKIGRITTAGVITEYPVPSSGGPLGIARGADGKIWFTEMNSNKIGRLV